MRIRYTGCGYNLEERHVILCRSIRDNMYERGRWKEKKYITRILSAAELLSMSTNTIHTVSLSPMSLS